MKKKYLSAEQAISLLPEGDYIHTLYGGFALIGADWERQEVIDKLKSVDKIEIAGDVARNIGHGLAVYNDDAQYYSDILFVETDKKKLDAFDPIEEDTTDGECCAKCKYYHRLKNNFKVGEGFEESHCCDVLLHLPKDESEGWVQEVTPQNRCEMYKEKDHVADADKMIEPTTKNNLVDGKDNNATSTDCISRQEAIDTIRQLYLDLASQKAVIDILKVLPSVTPQPKHGIWQQINKNEVNVIPEYRCSECGAEYKGFGFDFDYCPRCGCAMEVEE